jgi:transcriptional regulator with XRE-family HTH domain
VPQRKLPQTQTGVSAPSTPRAGKRSRSAVRLSHEAQLAEDGLRARLGSRVREARRQRRLTAQELADLASVTRSFISQIERGEVTPSISTMYRVTQALGIPLGELFEAQPPAQDVVLRPKDWTIYQYPGDPSEDAVLSVDSQKRLEVVWSRFPPEAATGIEATAVPGADIEFVFVLRGQVELDLDSGKHVLDERCCITFDGRSHHGWRNSGSKPAEVISVLVRVPAVYGGVLL